MSVSHEKIIADMMQKLGLSKDSRLVSKCKEMYDRLALKSSGISAALNDSAKIVLCLDISCEILNISFDESAGIKYSSLTKSKYRNNRKILTKLMELDKKLDVSGAVLKMGITNPNVEKTAKRIFEAYKKESFEKDDLDHPQYYFQSVYQACKLEKVKVQKKIFITASNLQPNQWTRMEKQWEKWVGSVGSAAEKENKKIRNEEVENDQISGSEVRIKRKQQIEEVEDYDVWAKRIKEEATKQIKAGKSS